MLLARLKPSPTLTSQASSSALHKLSKVLPFIHVSDEGPHLPAEVIRAARVCASHAFRRPTLSDNPPSLPLLSTSTLAMGCVLTGIWSSPLLSNLHLLFSDDHVQGEVLNTDMDRNMQCLQPCKLLGRMPHVHDEKSYPPAGVLQTCKCVRPSGTAGSG